MDPAAHARLIDTVCDMFGIHDEDAVNQFSDAEIDRMLSAAECKLAADDASRGGGP